MSLRQSPVASSSGKHTPKSAIPAEPTEIPRLATPSGNLELSHIWDLLRNMQERMVSLQEQNKKMLDAINDISYEQIEQREALTLLKERTRDIIDTVGTIPKTPPQGAPIGTKATPRAAPGPSHIHSPTPIRPGSTVRFMSGLGSPIPKIRSPSPAIPTPAPKHTSAIPSSAVATHSSPTATSTGSQKPPKMKEPDNFDGIRGRSAKQWWTRVVVWATFQRPVYPTEVAMLLHILTWMKPGKAANWAQPVMEKLVHQKTNAPNTLDKLSDAFYAAFLDPDASRAAMRQLHDLKQKHDANAYTTEFNNLAADLDWSDKEALKAQYEQGLAFQVKAQLIQRDPYPATLAALQETAIKIDGLYQELNQSNPRRKAQGPTKEKPKPSGGSSQKRETMSLEERKKLPNYISEEEQKARKEAGLCIICGSSDHMFRECKNGWRKERVSGKGKPKETAKIAEEEESEKE